MLINDYTNNNSNADGGSLTSFEGSSNRSVTNTEESNDEGYEDSLSVEGKEVFTSNWIDEDCNTTKIDD